MNFENTLNKYKQKLIYHDLNRHIKPIRNSYQYFIVIPVLNELEYLFKTLNSINNQNSELLKKTLIVIVINNRVDSSIHIKKNNRLTYEKIKKCNFEFENVTLDYFSNGNELSVKKYGVGVARKIGMDYCLQFATGNSLLFSLDADTLISKSYLQLITKYYHSSNFNTCIVKFLHQKSSNPKIEKAIRLYEDILYDIAYKIKQCNSPYGYVSMGSTIICKVKAYIAVGGMPQKSAAEDFYFMQSLAKFSKINFLNKNLVYPSPRLETRVHLGTGFRMLQYNKNDKFIDLSFTDRCYDSLKKLIDFVDSHYKISYNLFIKELNKNFDYNICNFLSEHNFENIWDKINNNAGSKKQFLIFFHQWFDGLKIMKFLKYMNK